MRTVILWMWWYAYALGMIALLAEAWSPGIVQKFMYLVTYT